MNFYKQVWRPITFFFGVVFLVSEMFRGTGAKATLSLDFLFVFIVGLAGIVVRLKVLTYLVFIDNPTGQQKEASLWTPFGIILIRISSKVSYLEARKTEQKIMLLSIVIIALMILIHITNLF